MTELQRHATEPTVAVIRGMQVASEVGKLAPSTTFHCLRHTHTPHLVQGGAPLLFVAAALGHRDARMVEKRYGHFAQSHVASVIRAELPTFGIVRRQSPTADAEVITEAFAVSIACLPGWMSCVALECRSKYREQEMAMSKGMNQKKQEKKKPAKTLEEKRAVKKAKNAERRRA
jgi:hypothetical protein